jgi:hypothetical protein
LRCRSIHSSHRRLRGREQQSGTANYNIRLRHQQGTKTTVGTVVSH